jgi:antirestriction protein ArdC
MEKGKSSQRQAGTLYGEVTDRIISELEAGRVPWIQPWDGAKVDVGMPRNAGTGRRYSGINVLILWARLFERGFASQGWLTYRQAQALGGNVRKGETGTTVCYADRFTRKNDDSQERGEGEARQIAFLKRFTVFNVDQCENLPQEIAQISALPCGREIVPAAEALMVASGARISIGGAEAYYMPALDRIQLPPQQAFYDQVNFYRTALHELGQWTGHASRLDRLGGGNPQGEDYAREELVAEICSAFVCAELGIKPTVRHADYLACWLSVLREDSRAIFRAASAASKAADFLLAFGPTAESNDVEAGQ